MKKTVLVLFITLLCLFVFCSIAVAADTMQLFSNDKYVVLRDTNPMIVNNGRSFIPLRVVTELIGYDIDWNPIEKAIIINEDDVCLKLQIGSYIYNINGETYEFDVAPFINNNRSYVPIRLLGELGLNVEYNKEYNTVILAKKELQNESLFNDNGIKILSSSICADEENTILEFGIQNSSSSTLEKGEIVLGIYSDNKEKFSRINHTPISLGECGNFTEELPNSEFDMEKTLYIEILVSSVKQSNFTEIMGWPPTIVIDLP